MALLEKEDLSKINDSEKLELQITSQDDANKTGSVQDSSKWTEIPLPRSSEARAPLREGAYRPDASSICPRSTMERRFIIYGVVTFLVIIVAIVLMLQDKNTSMRLAGGVLIAAASGFSCVVMAADLILSGRCRRL